VTWEGGSDRGVTGGENQMGFALSRCSQRIRVKGDRGGARGGGAGLCVEAERAGGMGRSGRNDHSTVARS
jgi:hypothetical protein